MWLRELVWLHHKAGFFPAYGHGLGLECYKEVWYE
jgi:hypothetical protein